MSTPTYRTSILKAVLWDSAFALIPTILLFTMSPKATWSAAVHRVSFFLDLFQLHRRHCVLLRIRRFGSELASSRNGFAGAPAWLRCLPRAWRARLIAGLFFVALRWQPMSAYWPQFLGSLKFAAFLTIAAGLTIGIYSTLRERLDETTLQLRTKELERERALKLATEAQLASLESRIHPHFLFNTLNSISALIPEDPGARRTPGGTDGRAAALLARRQSIRPGAARERAQDRRRLSGN